MVPDNGCRRCNQAIPSQFGVKCLEDRAVLAARAEIEKLIVGS